MKNRSIFLISFLCFYSHCFPQIQGTGSPGWNEIAVFESPGVIGGLAYDGHGIFISSTGLYRFDPLKVSFTYVCSVPCPPYPYYPVGGLTYKSPLFVSTIGWYDGYYYQQANAIYFDTAGVIQFTSPLPGLQVSIVTWNETSGSLWVSNSGWNTIEEVTTDGTIIKTIGPLPMNIAALCMQGPFFWVAGRNDSIYKIDFDGNIVERHAPLHVPLSALVYDDAHLWYATGHQLVEVEVYGTGVDDNKRGSFHLLNVYPNPASGKITIKTAEKGRFSILEPGGRELLTREIDIPGETLDIGAFRPGVYLFKMAGAGNVLTGKLVRQ